MNNVLISVVSHNQKNLVINFLESFERYVENTSYKVTICITNNLNDEEWTSKYTKFQLKTIQNIHPKGFGDNHNTAFTFLESDYFLIVNPDVEIKEDLILDDLIASIPSRGIASPNILSKSGSTEDFLRYDLGPMNLVKRMFKIGKSR